MADALALTRRVSERGVHEMVQRAGGAGATVVRHYVGYEEWAGDGFLRRETARHGVALILGFGDTMDVFEDEVGSAVRALGAFVVGNQSRSSVTGVAGHQLGVQLELTPAGALGLFGAVGDLNDAVVPLDEALGGRAAHLVDRLAETPSWETRLDLLDEALGGDPVPSLTPEVAWLRCQLLACTVARRWSRYWTRRGGAAATSPSGSGANSECPPRRTRGSCASNTPGRSSASFPPAAALPTWRWRPATTTSPT
jgi:hypothetical protein